MSPDEHVAAVLKQAPPLSPEQAQRLAALLDVARKVTPKRRAAA